MNQVEKSLLADSQLTREQLEQTLNYIHQYNVDYSDLYFQSSYNETWVLEDGNIKEGSYNIERGVGVRAVSGEQTGFSYSDAINLEAINQAAEAARSIAQQGESKTVQVFTDVKAPIQFQPVQPLLSMSDEEKITLLREVDSAIRELAPDAQQVVCSIAAVYEEVLIAASDGTFATDIRPLVRLNCSVLLENNGRRERGSAGGGARLDYGYFKELEDGQPRWMSYAIEAVRQARVNLTAIDAPAGTMPVVLGSGWPGVLLHEAVGHGLEGDFNRKGASAFSGRVGEQVASSLCTVVDDGTMANRRGSLNIDDEGTPAGYNVLIENGILKGYMQDKMNARLMDAQPTGNARRESFAHLPMPRMTNTYMLAGESTQQEIISSVKKGIFASNFGGGQVDITSGKFVFSASEAYLIEDGKVTQPIKGATLIGNGPEAMQQISMVGNDLSLDRGVGVCGKDGQSVPVGVGQPSLKIDQLTVGGTA
ncbi:metalloprotease TldD [Pseudoalteromonas luteoviolacea]|uniref:Protease TldD n=1 Tax=Pseudoalteromonas luteoviolacea S4054 TaxID=1129367 RepID=A0A0F6ACY3_9GAMM|nr:metalloprotease TldD [Pseudoalteromonas luteoviolacea]AOT09802.1 metalloprotease TldD [Pseudoalteromonas luteoviolacea]AOT14714.1 metalloprotease TldD [Pseudoalteromonas luteoviolacea]AOT19629.1 metalloprotease TldD [Pseudoalteromonas luteoviolacea]KKE84072.1 protease TldD [Pseudoalteromonas luteoviolacea S4054]KZN77466.1 protease TldD [Pseudoalteromonas luteoviolacea S4047-1]